ncbi:hypothetical protein C8F04DRAFT_1096242 [Mycena alexandri]|uniref:Uncharacterized protein n=1 Tax=Mycena alexandri TaxID=1745969 RepID=A0AAD6SZW5_9AGAR|nr:hypothetical protein C8F04DRAFT_1110282 [Mycena alexandri]KAJ7036131.1 hypothetical protein C8F04DRAFT_1096242 [Mycena alexandri]
MHLFSLICLLSALILAVFGVPIGIEPPPPTTGRPASNPAAPPVKPGATGPGSAKSSPPEASPAANTPVGGNADIFQPLQLTNETLPHLGLEDEARPKAPHGLCVIA